MAIPGGTGPNRPLQFVLPRGPFADPPLPVDGDHGEWWAGAQWAVTRIAIAGALAISSNAALAANGFPQDEQFFDAQIELGSGAFSQRAQFSPTFIQFGANDEIGTPAAPALDAGDWSPPSPLLVAPVSLQPQEDDFTAPKFDDDSWRPFQPLTAPVVSVASADDDLPVTVAATQRDEDQAFVGYSELAPQWITQTDSDQPLAWTFDDTWWTAPVVIAPTVQPMVWADEDLPFAATTPAYDDTWWTAPQFPPAVVLWLPPADEEAPLPQPTPAASEFTGAFSQRAQFGITFVCLQQVDELPVTTAPSFVSEDERPYLFSLPPDFNVIVWAEGDDATPTVTEDDIDWRPWINPPAPVVQLWLDQDEIGAQAAALNVTDDWNYVPGTNIPGPVVTTYQDDGNWVPFVAPPFTAEDESQPLYSIPTPLGLTVWDHQDERETAATPLFSDEEYWLPFLPQQWLIPPPVFFVSIDEEFPTLSLPPVPTGANTIFGGVWSPLGVNTVIGRGL